MRNITNELSMEHQHILKVIELVINECDRIENGNSIDKEFFEKTVHFIQKYADGFHHAKEEDILFKAMLNNQDHMHCNPIPVMLREHDTGRHYVKGMLSALKENKKDELVENARRYCYLLQNHIYKEDNVLYPMAEAALDDQEKYEVETLYSKINVNNFIDTDIELFIEKLSPKVA